MNKVLKTLYYIRHVAIVIGTFATGVNQVVVKTITLH